MQESGGTWLVTLFALVSVTEGSVTGLDPSTQWSKSTVPNLRCLLSLVSMVLLSVVQNPTFFGVHRCHLWSKTDGGWESRGRRDLRPRQRVTEHKYCEGKKGAPDGSSWNNPEARGPESEEPRTESPTGGVYKGFKEKENRKKEVYRLESRT